MRILIINEAVKEALYTLKKHAEENPFNLDDMLDIMNKAEKPAGDREGFSCCIPVDFRVVFTIETHPQGLSRHLSVSVPTEGRSPHPEAVKLIMKELGFVCKLEDCTCYLEDEKVINVVELIK